MFQEDAIAGVAVVGVEVEVDSVEVVVAMAVEVVMVMQAVMVTQAGGVVEAEKGIAVVEAVTVMVRALGVGFQGIPLSLRSFLKISVHKELLQGGCMVLCTDKYPLVTVVMLAVVASL
jgi:hypothetical protein